MASSCSFSSLPSTRWRCRLHPDRRIVNLHCEACGRSLADRARPCGQIEAAVHAHCVAASSCALDQTSTATCLVVAVFFYRLWMAGSPDLKFRVFPPGNTKHDDSGDVISPFRIRFMLSDRWCGLDGDGSTSSSFWSADIDESVVEAPVRL